MPLELFTPIDHAATVSLVFRRMKVETFLGFELLQKVNLNHPGAGHFRLASDLSGILAGRDRPDKRRFLGVSRLKTGALEGRLLVCLPIIILLNETAVLVP